MAVDARRRYRIENEQLPPFHAAVYNGEIEKVKSIFESFNTRKAQTHNLNEICQELTPLDIAIATQNEDMVRLLLQQPGIHVNRLPGQGNSSLFRAATLPSSAIMQALLQRVIDINYQEDAGYTALLVACQYGQADTLKLLLN